MTNPRLYMKIHDLCDIYIDAVCVGRIVIENGLIFTKIQENFITSIKTCKRWHVPHV